MYLFVMIYEGVHQRVGEFNREYGVSFLEALVLFISTQSLRIYFDLRHEWAGICDLYIFLIKLV